MALNPQLPPALAQQQVSPTTLPGFSLPSGQNGLFRLSGQGTGNPAENTAVGPVALASTRETQSYDSTNVASVINAGHDLTINSQQGSDGGVSLNGGRDVTVIGSRLAAGNDLLLGGTGDVTVAAGENESGASSKKTKSGMFGLSKSGRTELQTQTTQAGSVLAAGNDAVLVAGRDVQLSASAVEAGHDAQLQAGVLDTSGDVRLNAGSNEAYVYAESWKKKVGLSLVGGSSLTGSGGGTGFGISLAQGRKSGHESSQATNIGSSVSAGNDASLNAARDISLTGSAVSADGTLALNAGRDITLAAGSEAAQQASWSSKTAAGLSLSADRNGFSAFAGQEAAKGKTTQGHDGASPSTLDGWDVTLAAGRDIVQSGSDVSAVRDVAYSAGRNITLEAARERDTASSEASLSRSGASVTVNHNLGNTADALKGAGKGEDSVSKASSTLAAVDAFDQFARGPTLDGTLGNSKTRESSAGTTVGARGSTINAGGDTTLVAGDTLAINGSQLSSGRDINLGARDITLGVANGQVSQHSEQQQSNGGIKGGTTNGFKVGIGAGSGVADQNSSQQTSLASSLSAGRDLNATAQNDLTLIGTQASAGRDVQLKAGNDLNILAAQNATASQDARHSGSGEVGLTVGQQGVGVYASVSMGKGTLDREANQAQMAQVQAGNAMHLASGRDTTVAGAQLRADSVSAEVGRDLTVSSVPDTGKASGKQQDVSATVTVGLGWASASGSLGYGRTTGETHWVTEQTAITAAEQLAIVTGEHTQLNGALLNSDTGKLKLDTQTLGYADIAGLDKEHSYYLNVGGSYGTGGTQDNSQTGKGEPGQNNWSVQGYNATTDRQQAVRATVGAGEIVVRGDAPGEDSTAGLNRDPSKAYEVTRDEVHRTDVYASSNSINAALHPFATVDNWKNQLAQYGDNTQAALDQGAALVRGAGKAAERAWHEIQAQQLSIDEVPASAKSALGSDETALLIAKNLVRNGKSPAELAQLTPGDLEFVKAAAQILSQYDSGTGTCVGQTGCSQGGQVPYKDGYAWADEQGNRQVAETSGLVVKTPGQLLLAKMEVVGSYLSALDPEKAQLVALSIQATMGPAKAAVGLAGNALVGALLGDQIQAVKDQVALTTAAALSGNSSSDIAASDAYLKRLHDAGMLDQEGDTYLKGASTLLDIALGVGVPVGGKVVARTVTVGSGAKGEVSGLLPKPGATSIPASGVGAGAAFKVDSKQLGKKLGKHVEDFGGNAASPADRKMVLDKIHDVASNPEKVVPGTFAGQGENGARGDVFFRIKGNDVVVTKPDGTFVTILKDGAIQNPSVQSALKGGVR
ncbi:hemagglutinin repeat-containing protein [Pseudomonas sp. NPDC007930]|uniref:hemagglutinin repeat-containing protein n=1 Tax=Pseudomonas sp. NPDC007930 TaxID=3364417 RepID=UPI0036E9E44E